MHQVETMAFVGSEPWHGLGSRLSKGENMEVWRARAGMDWTIERAGVEYKESIARGVESLSFPGRTVLYRSDNSRPLAVVSGRFQVVQPSEVLDFYHDLTELGGFELETAGVLKEGRKFWALARTGHSATLRGRDCVNGYLLLATACDGTLSTTAQFTSVRVVCNNTLAIALSGANAAVKVPHRTHFDAAAVKRRLGVAISSWDIFASKIESLAACPVDPDSVGSVLTRIFAGAVVDTSRASPLNERAIRTVMALYNGGGMGSCLPSSRGTAWGLLNSVTEFVDYHRRARSDDHRVDAAWFGIGAQIKQRAWQETLTLLE